MECDDTYHQSEIKEIDWKKILPFKRQELVDTQTGECPLEPDDDVRKENSLTYKPYRSGDIIHYGVETVPTGNMEGHPATEEQQCCYTRYDKKVKVFSEVEESEVDTGIFGVLNVW